MTSIDFGIVSGVRSASEQGILVDTGKSQTMDSRHLTGHAIDFAPYWNGRYLFSWPFYYPIAQAFMRASMETNIHVTWGGAWGVNLWECHSIQEAQSNYIRSVKPGKEPFFDGGHIELHWLAYPVDLPEDDVVAA
ncbi:MAG: M15 family metallopeptidase [Geminicoccaceae bacterium]